MGKILKKTLKITGITLLVLIVLAFLIPVLFKKQITSLVKKEINKSLVAKVDFKDVSLSLFRHFPKLSIALEELSVVGTEEFAGDTLIAAKSLDASVNIMSAIKGENIKVYGVFVESPRIHALVNKEGKANWDIAKDESAPTDTTTSGPSEFKMSLQKYEISDGYIYYNDESSDMSAEITGLDHEGSGDFTSDVFTLSTKTKAEAADFTYAGVPYLNKVKTDIDADIKIDNAVSKYSFKTDDVSINDLQLNTEGFFQLVNDSTYNMDITFKTPSNEFKDILSLVPGIYKQDFDKIKTNGTAAFNGFVKGIYSPQQMPSYDVHLDVKDASFQYPDLPKPIKNIQVALQASNPDGKPDNAVVNISKGHLEMDNEPFDFTLLFKNPETAQYIDAVAKGKIDLASISKFIKLDNGTKMAGLIWADVFAKGNMSALQNQSGNFNAGGFLDIKNLYYSSPEVPQPVQNGNIRMTIENTGGVADNTAINISSGHIEIGKDPVDFTLQLSKPMSVMDFAGTAKGRFTLDNIKQFTTLEPGTSIAGILTADAGFKGNKAAIDKGEYDKITLNGSVGASNVKYVSKEYASGISIPSVNATFNPKNVTINNFSGNYLKSNFEGNGSLDNVIGYGLKDEPLKGTLNVSVDKMNLNEWMGTTETTSTETASTSSEPFLVPANLNLTINAKAGNVKYDKVDYNNINGTITLANETVTLKNLKTDALEGTVTFNGSYSTLNSKKDPAIAINYDIKDVDVQKAFLAYNTFEKLMPIGQFLDGKLNSQLNMTGNLNGNMFPDLSTLTGKGNLLLLEGVLKKFAPLDKIASTLQIKELQSISLKDIKNTFEFANGKVLVKPFTVKVSDIEMQIGGMHGINQAIDYIVQMKVPRKYLGTSGNNLVNGLVTQANSKGIPVKMDDMIDLNVKLGGTITSPTIKTDLKEVAGDAVQNLEQQAKDFAQQKVDSAKQTIKDSLTSVKKQVTEDVKKEVLKQLSGNKDSLSGNQADTTKKNVEKTIKNTLKNILKKPEKQ